MQVVLYILIVIAVAAVIMILMGKKFSLAFLDFRPKNWQVYDNSNKFWKSGTVGAMHNLKAEDNIAPVPTKDSYTYQFEILLVNSRNLTNVERPYRHIFHRGSDELYPVGGPLGVLTGGNAFPPYGLPQRMNPGIFLDPNLNDILIFVDTKSPKGDIYRESCRISDIPLGKPFRLGVSVQDNILEVNLNCRLETTQVLVGIPRPVESVLYGLCGPAAAQASIQNLIEWPYSVVSRDLMLTCGPIGPFGPAVSSCELAAETNSINATIESAKRLTNDLVS